MIESLFNTKQGRLCLERQQQTYKIYYLNQISLISTEKISIIVFNVSCLRINQ